MNLDSITREVLRKLDNEDPFSAWDALKNDALSRVSSNKLITMDRLLDSEMESKTVKTYEKDFNETTKLLREMGVILDEDLLLAIFLRGLPSSFDHVIPTIRHRAGINLEEAVRILDVEERAALKKSAQQSVQSSTALATAKAIICSHCNGDGHTKDGLHPEKRPRCTNCGGRNHWAKTCSRKSAQANCVDAAFDFFDEKPYTL